MKMILSALFLSFSISNLYAYDIEYIHLKDGTILDGRYNDYEIPLNEIRAIEFSEEHDSSKTILFQLNSKIIKGEFNKSQYSVKSGGEGGGT